MNYVNLKDLKMYSDFIILTESHARDKEMSFEELVTSYLLRSWEPNGGPFYDGYETCQSLVLKPRL